MNAKLRPAVANKTWIKLFPFLTWMRSMTLDTLQADFMAGLTGAVIVLPQGVAFALIAGLPPEYGLYTAIVTPVIAALFGSSWHLVSGPTTAISIVMLDVVSNFAAPGSPDYLNYALTVTFIAGMFQLLLGVGRMGGLVNFISHTVVIGFTSGAAVLIATNQFKYLFGLPVQQREPFFKTLSSLFEVVSSSNGYALLIATVTLGIALLVRRYRPRWPYMLSGMIVGSLVCLLIDGHGHGVPLLGALPGDLPPWSVPEFSMAKFHQLAPGAFAVAMLGLIEAVSIARAVATRSQQRINGNQEFIGQGLSNLFGSFFSCYAGSGSFTRSGVNYDAGAKTPLSTIFASLLVALVLLYLAPLTAYLPVSAMAAVIVLVAWNLIDTHHIRLIAKTSKREIVVLVVTFLATLLITLEFAIYVGVLASLVIYLQRTSRPNVIVLAPDPNKPKRRLGNVIERKLPECPQLKIVRIDGSLFFGAVDHTQNVLHELAKQNAEWKHVLIIAGGINFIDVAGAEMLAQEARRMRRKGGGLYLCRLNDVCLDILERGGYLDSIGRNHIFRSKEEAIRLIFQRLDVDRCSICVRRIFRECATVAFEGRGILS